MRTTKSRLRRPLQFLVQLCFVFRRGNLENFADAIRARINEHGDSRLRMTTTKSHLRPTYTVPSSVVLWTPTRELRKFRGCHSGDSRLRMTTTKSHLRPTYTVPSSVVLWTPTRELRKFRGCHSGDSRLRMTTTKSRLRRTFTVPSSVVLWTSTSELRKFHTTGRVSICLKPTVWTVEQSVSGVLYISSLLRSPKLPKRKGISDRGF
ncbi:hypothetical protein V1477_011780 [Vespula maculifrons]|uniref:Secreted protein n=1 Tax=Vespula maculifrons TaxID=7453 RepID=A0ABD2C062_VESMC